jgi:transcriptional regulator with XRE-family HTH domain
MLMWDRQLTQAALGERVGIEQSGLAKKLRGQRGWALAEIVAVADALDVTIASLFGEEPEPTRPRPTGAHDAS